jgi:hypothetical protein
MTLRHPLVSASLVGLAVSTAAPGPTPRTGGQQWAIHDPKRPAPPVVDPGAPPEARPAPPPSDAIVLFGGSDLSQWRTGDGRAARWKIAGGAMEVVGSAGDLLTKEDFGDCQLHIEWAAPVPPAGDDQGRGNSGVFLMDRYEIQILDSYQNRTYADGQAAAVYGQFPPLVNASRPPGQWQSYDIVFRRPRFDRGGKLLRPARVTVLHNGVLVQDNVELTGPTAHKERPPYQAHADALPLRLQDHGNPVRFRNIWIRRLERDPGQP